MPKYKATSTHLYTGDNAFFPPCFGVPSPRATTQSPTFLILVQVG